jgi:hypothetical protein
MIGPLHPRHIYPSCNGGAGGAERGGFPITPSGDDIGSNPGQGTSGDKGERREPAGDPGDPGDPAVTVEELGLGDLDGISISKSGKNINGGSFGLRLCLMVS